MSLPGFRRDPIREELRRLNRESARLGQTTRRLVEESAQIPRRPAGAFSASAPISRREPVLKVEGRLARRKVLLAASVAAALAYILFRLVAGWTA